MPCIPEIPDDGNILPADGAVGSHDENDLDIPKPGIISDWNRLGEGIVRGLDSYRIEEEEQDREGRHFSRYSGGVSSAISH
jgi:hypothetical protein